MEHCGLDIFQQCGLMDYHLKILLDARILKKGIGYKLTDYGKHVAEILDGAARPNCKEKREVAGLQSPSAENTVAYMGVGLF